MTNTPRVMPAFGAWLTLEGKSRVYGSVGIQFISTGATERIETSSYDQQTSKWVDSDSKEQFRMNKIWIPVTIGIKYKIKKFNGSVFAGSGIQRYLNASYSWHKQSEGIITQEHIDPFDASSLDITAVRQSTQFFLGTGWTFNERYYVSLTYSAGRRFYFQERMPPGTWDATFYAHDYARTELVLSLRYKFPLKG